MPTVLITGANRGIGLEFARQYAAEGWRVIASCRDPSKADTLNALGGDVSVHTLDIAAPEQIAALAKELDGTAIDLLLLNAGIHPQWQRPMLAETDFDVWPEVFNINTIAPIRVAAAFVAHVAASDRRIVAAMSSGAGSIARRPGGNYVYASSKAALNLCIKGLSEEWRDRGIAAVALSPGGVRTDMNRRSATRPVDEAVAMLRQVLDDVTMKDTGRFIHLDGTDLPW